MKSSIALTASTGCPRKITPSPRNSIAIAAGAQPRLVDLTQPEESRKVLFDLSINDAYDDPGTPVTVTRPDGITDDPQGR